jgi:hypothetical protein
MKAKFAKEVAKTLETQAYSVAKDLRIDMLIAAQILRHTDDVFVNNALAQVLRGER